MIAYWLQHLSDEISVLNLFKYITVRSALAAATAFFVSLYFGPWLIKKLKQHGYGEKTEKGDSLHLDDLHSQKDDTPTFGGLLFISATIFSMLLWARPDLDLVWVSLLILILCSLIGFADDLLKVKGRKGLKGRSKMLLLCVIAIASSWWLMNEGPRHPQLPDYGTLHFPFFKDYDLYLGAFYFLLAIFVFSGTANAVNITDGLDGLAIGAYVPLIGSFSIICYLAGHKELSHYLLIPFIPGAGELTVLCSALFGACLGFLWFNCHPAELFMGDTGSLALGGIIGFVSLVVRQELVLLLAGGVFVIETLSVLMQTCNYKLTGKRVFRCAPLHHHFQFMGLHENKITIRFWILGSIMAILALLTLKVR